MSVDWDLDPDDIRVALLGGGLVAFWASFTLNRCAAALLTVIDHAEGLACGGTIVYRPSLEEARRNWVSRN